VNIGNGTIEKLSDLNNAEAMKLFSTWYETGAEYNYKNGPTKEMAKKAGKFIVKQIMFIIMFLELFINC